MIISRINIGGNINLLRGFEAGKIRRNIEALDKQKGIFGNLHFVCLTIAYFGTVRVVIKIMMNIQAKCPQLPVVRKSGLKNKWFSSFDPTTLHRERVSAIRFNNGIHGIYIGYIFFTPRNQKTNC